MNNATYETAKILKARIAWLEKIIQQLDEIKSDPDSNFKLGIHSVKGSIAIPNEDLKDLHYEISKYFQKQYDATYRSFTNL